MASALRPGRRAGPAAESTSLSDLLAGLERLDLADLRVRFRNHTGRIAPARLGRQLLLRVLAYRIQADAYGDLKPDTRRLLARLTGEGASEPREGAGQGAVPPPVPVIVRPQRGSVLVREWRGRLEQVQVGDDGYHWQGTVYPSLSAVAQAITGAKWNGRRFFGLDRPEKTGAPA